MGYRPKHFIIQELVPPKVYQEMGERSWQLLDSRLLVTIDAMHNAFGTIIINNWHSGGSFQESGFRTPYSPTGVQFSQHRSGRAGDLKLNLSPIEAFNYIQTNRDKFPYLTAVENPEKTVTWLHIDVRNTDRDEIQVFEP